MKKLYLFLLLLLFLPLVSHAQERGQSVLVKNQGAANGLVGQVVLSVTASQVAPFRLSRHSIAIKNTDAAITVYYGFTSAVTSTTGFPLKAGESQSIDSQRAIFMVSASGTPTIAYSETYD